MKKIFIIILAIFTTGWLVYAGLCNIGWTGNGQNNSTNVETESGIHMWWWHGMGQWTGQGSWNAMNGGWNTEHFQQMLSMKWERLETLSQDLEEIIDLAEKTGYDTTKLESYKVEVEQLKSEYEELDGDVDEMCTNKSKWRGANGQMRELMQNISEEFQNIKNSWN